jgi:hypothetical protein
MTERYVNRLRWSAASTAAVLALLLGWVGVQSVPSSEAVRLRNALLIEPPSITVGQWLPDNVPAGFLVESRPVPVLLAEAARVATAGVGGGELEHSRALVAHLLANVRDSGPIAAVSVERTYREIVDEGRGYCSDYIDVFVALAHAVGISVRTWAFSFDGYGGRGHVVAEIYDRTLSQWVMLDVFNNVHPVRDNGALLSALEFRRLFADDPGSVRFDNIGPGRVGYRNDAKLREYYRNGIDQWYLWNGNNVITRGDAAPYLLLAPSPGAAQLLAIGLDDYPRLVPLLTSSNGELIARMRSLGVRLRVVIAIVAVLALALLLQGGVLLMASKPPRRSRRISTVPEGEASYRKDRHA